MSSHGNASPPGGLAGENERLRAEVAALTARLRELDGQLRARASSGDSQPAPDAAQAEAACAACPARQGWQGEQHCLSKAQVERYSRQLLLPAFGVRAQDRLCRAGVLVVGAGGLGCPAAIYLAAAGVGRLGICDRDAVDASNLHRQVLHTEAGVGQPKAQSAAAACRALNSTVQVTAYCEGLTPANALSLVAQYDCVVDASDNPPTRYLASDACCVLRKPLVFGAAIGTDGQLTVYCHGDDGPCHRCLHPRPPAPENCAKCAEAGVLGPVPGVVGTLQALEAIKLVTGVGSALSRQLLVADLLRGRFACVRLRARQPDCAACGQRPSITADSLPAFDYAAFTGQPFHDGLGAEAALLPPEQRLDSAQLAAVLSQQEAGGQLLLLDVRPPEQFNAAHLPGAHSLPFDERRPERFQAAVAQLLRAEPGLAAPDARVAVVCRRGNDSQAAVRVLRQRFGLRAADLRGGLLDWARAADASFPAL